ncbi:MAG: hypothetical protein KAJ86_08035 [Alphaproteobacteria bacterium]|nr:hypothetical protein [Alphaproteobacteria bacterium]
MVAVVTPATAQAENDIHGWDDPSKAEFIIQDVATTFRYPGNHTLLRDIHIDCDLLVKFGAKAVPTVGFVGQFNAENEATWSALSSSAKRNLTAWKGSLDYRFGKVNGVLIHMSGAHEITNETVKNAFKTCREDHADHGVDSSDLLQYGK